MITPPTGAVPNAGQVVELDDAFFTTDPLGYFTARTESLLAFADGARPIFEAGVSARYAAALRRERAEIPAASDEARELQVAIDAMSLRQHAAEAVVRLWAAVLQTRDATPATVSVWDALTNGRQSIHSILRDDVATAGPLGPEESLALVLPAPLITAFPHSANLQRAVEVLARWLEHAERLLLRDDIHLGAANNKVKHGLAVRARADSPMHFLGTPPPTSLDFGMPASRARDSIPLFTAPSVEYLARPPADEVGKHGWS